MTYKFLSNTYHLSGRPKKNICLTANLFLAVKFVSYLREGGENGLFITLVPKVLLLLFLIRWLYNFGDFYWTLIGLFIKLSVQMFQPLIVIYRRGIILYIINGNELQLIAQCLIPLDPWSYLHMFPTMLFNIICK